MENENMIIEEAVVAEGEEIIIEEVPTDAIDVVVEEEVTEETADEEIVEEEAESATDRLSRKCKEVKAACCETINRIMCDLKETNYNPYIKQTRITRVEIYRSCTDEEPIDTFEKTDVKSYSAKALLAASAATALLIAVSGKFVKGFLN